MYEPEPGSPQERDKTRITIRRLAARVEHLEALLDHLAAQARQENTLAGDARLREITELRRGSVKFCAACKKHIAGAIMLRDGKPYHVICDPRR